MTGRDVGITRIHQGNEYLRPLVKSLIDLPVKAMSDKLPKKYVMDISPARLEITNIVIDLKGAEPKCTNTLDPNPHANEILISAMSCLISTDESDGISYIFTCNKTRLAAAMQLESMSSIMTHKHIDMIQYALANMKNLLANFTNMEPKEKITAYICGMTANKGNSYFANDQKLINDRLILKSAVYELNSRGVNAEIFFGKKYRKQTYDLVTRKYEPGDDRKPRQVLL